MLCYCLQQLWPNNQYLEDRDLWTLTMKLIHTSPRKVQYSSSYQVSNLKVYKAVVLSYAKSCTFLYLKDLASLWRLRQKSWTVSTWTTWEGCWKSRGKTWSQKTEVFSWGDLPNIYILLRSTSQVGEVTLFGHLTHESLGDGFTANCWKTSAWRADRKSASRIHSKALGSTPIHGKCKFRTALPDKYAPTKVSPPRNRTKLQGHKEVGNSTCPEPTPPLQSQQTTSAQPTEEPSKNTLNWLVIARDIMPCLLPYYVFAHHGQWQTN